MSFIEILSKETMLLVALILAAAALVTALLAYLSARASFRAHLETRLAEIKRAFADAYVGMKDGSADVQKVREAERAIEKVIRELENYLK